MTAPREAGALDREVRKRVFDHFLEETTAPSAPELAAGLGCGVEAVRASLQRLDEAHHLKLLEGTTRILMAFPFRAIATPYRVTRRNRRRYFANCAWDALAFHPMMQEPIVIDSFCDDCGAPVHFEVAEGEPQGPEGSIPLVWLKLPASQWWSDITRTCANTMVYLCARGDHTAEAGGTTLSDRGILRVEQVLRMSVPIYRGKLELSYARPPVEVLRSTYKELGLTGPHWSL